jgi:acetolactate synthase-1/2/3 large subunit
MGFALPTAIGASLGTGKRVIVIAGDGGFQMNIQELELLHRRKLPVKIFIMNNAFLGMVRQMQDEFLGQNYVGTQYDYSMPNFKKVAEVYGIISHEVSRMDKMEETIAAALANDACELVDIHLCEDKHLVEPRMAGNRPMEDMRPFLERDALKTQMMIDLLDE